MKKMSTLVFVLLFASFSAFAEESMPDHRNTDTPDHINVASPDEDENFLDDLNPFADDIDDQLRRYDETYESETGESAWDVEFFNLWNAGCYREQCPIYIDISKSEQKALLYVNGILQGEYLVSTGVSGYTTPDFDMHPNGRIYDRYTSTKYPGGDYISADGKRLGNMPYAVFIRGGFAIHGTGRGNWKKLGNRASHGCIRMHPDNAFIFNRLVRQYGISKTWIRVR